MGELLLLLAFHSNSKIVFMVMVMVIVIVIVTVTVTIYQVSSIKYQENQYKNRPEKSHRKDFNFECDRSEKKERKITTYVCGAEHPSTLCAELD